MCSILRLPKDLSFRACFFLPSWQAMLPDGTVFEGKGIAPDVVVETEQADFARRDPVLEKALELIEGP